MSKWFVCSCFYSHNIYIKDLGTHVIYHNKEQFMKEYSQVLTRRGFSTEKDIETVIETIEKEINRRSKLGAEHVKRKEIIQQTYKPLHQDIYALKTEFLAPDFVALVEYCQTENATIAGVLQHMGQHTVEKLYSVPVFTEEFCIKFLEELKHFEESDCPKGQPNTMNHYGILLDDIGFNDFVTSLREQYLIPITGFLYPEWGGQTLDSHKAFIVKYKINEDRDLSYHYDNAEVTLNVSLSADFTGGSLYFGGMRNVGLTDTECTEYQHAKTIGILHRGQHMHGALPIQSGERYNLIIWMRSSEIRNKLCPMCNRKPDLVESEGYGDGFTEENQQVDVCLIY